MTIPTAKDKPLFTPGPLTTSHTVKQAMLRDLGSRDTEFIDVVRRVRDGLLRIAGVSQETGYEAILMQGSGTFSLEAVLSSTIPPAGKLLVAVNGAYGERLVEIARIHGIETTVLRFPEHEQPSVADLEQSLTDDAEIAMVAVTHCETTSGIVNPIAQMGRIAAKHGCRYFVDSMSAFGAVPFDLRACQIDYLVSSSNKCLEGVPGFAFIICRRDSLLETEGWSRTLSLDLFDQWRGLESNGQFRFTPPTHAILAFHQALVELEQEGGVAGRAARYQANHRVLIEGMRRLGFEEYVSADLQGHIITSFRYPDHPNFDFGQFYALLNERGFVIYPGKVSSANCFRIGNIGRLFPSDMQALLAAITDVLTELEIIKLDRLDLSTLSPSGRQHG